MKFNFFVRVLSLVAGCFIALPFAAFGSADPDMLDLADFTKLSGRNSIEPKSIGEFWRTWPLVTVRFRQDNGEARFIYANKIAYDALLKGDQFFPQGAIFAKIAYKLEQDPTFPSSEVPGPVTRIQIMLKTDGAKDSAGWVYWVKYGPNPRAKSAEESTDRACHACHLLAKEHDFIFSKPVAADATATSQLPAKKTFPEQFALTKLSELSQEERRFLVEAKIAGQNPRVLRLPAFHGSLSESTLPVALAAKSGATFLLADTGGVFFLAGEVPANKPKACPDGVFLAKSMSRRHGDSQKWFDIVYGVYCDGAKIEWTENRKALFDSE